MSAKYDIHVATFYQGRREDSLPFKIHRTIPLFFDLTKMSGASFGKLVSDFFLLLLVGYLVCRYRIRIIDGHLHEGAFIGLFYKFLFKCRVIYNVHGTLTQEMVASGTLSRESSVSHWLQRFENWVENYCDLIISQSSYRKDAFILKGIEPERIVVVEDAPIGEAYDDVGDEKLTDAIRSSVDCVFIYAGEMMTYQGIDLILDALRDLVQEFNRIRCIFFGRPMDEYRKKIFDQNLQQYVSLIDNEPFSRLKFYLAASDVALVPRLYGENVPGKLPIYMMAGKAIIGTDLPGINSVIDHMSTGLLIKPYTADLIEKMKYCITNPDEVKRLGQAAKVTAQHRYDSNRLAKTMEGAYESLLLI